MSGRSDFREQLEDQFGWSGSAAKEIAGGLVDLIIKPVLFIIGASAVLIVLMHVVDEASKQVVINIWIFVVIFGLLGGAVTAILRISSGALRIGTQRLTDTPLNTAVELDQLIDELASALEDERTEVVAEAFRELARIGLASVRVLPSIAERAVPGQHVTSTDDSAISIGHEALATLGAIGAPAIPVIQEALRNELRTSFLKRDFAFVNRARAALDNARSLA